MSITPKNGLLSGKRVRSMLVFIGVILIFLILNQFPFFARFTRSFQAGLYAIGNGIDSLSDRAFRSPSSMQGEIDQLKLKVTALAIDQSELTSLRQQVEELESQLNYQQNLVHTAIPARIIARAVNFEHSLLINQGSNAGLRENLAVVVEDGHLIGTLVDVQKSYSTVQLLSDPQSKIPAAIQNQANSTIGLIEGQGGYFYEMNLIPQTENIEVDSIVVTSGLEGHLPPNLVIGLVKEVIKIDTESFSSAHIEPLVDIRDYTRVLVIDPLGKL